MKASTLRWLIVIGLLASWEALPRLGVEGGKITGHEVGEAADQAFIALEFIEGQSLARRLHGTPWPADQAAALVEILARAMCYAHEKGIIHRDLKPSNIMMRLADGPAEPVIVDFGLARCVEPGLSRITASGLFIGSSWGVREMTRAAVGGAS